MARASCPTPGPARRRPRGGRGVRSAIPIEARGRGRAAGPARAARPRRGPGRRAHARGRRLAARTARAARWTIVASILRDKDAEAMLERLAAAGSTLIATRSSNPRALAEQELAARAEPYFEHVESVADPVEALGARARLGPVLVTGLALPACRPPRHGVERATCARPGGSGSPSSPSRLRSSPRSSASRSRLAT